MNNVMPFSRALLHPRYWFTWLGLGLLWLLVMFVQLKKYGLTPTNKTRMACLSLFWHFLDLIWIGVFSVVYLNGAL